jgi:hypothetical protein
MTNPTSNFGWQMPTNTDLVYQLPADFEVFGQAVDTSLADLKGGTSGQVLAKNSNTDMDFVWVAQDDSNAIQNAIVDAKGDLIAATAADTPARLAVGTNGQVLTADSTAATGIKWATPAGGGKVLQVVNATYSTSTANATTTYADTGLTATITPTLSTSKILVFVSQEWLKNDGNADSGVNLKLFRGATNLTTHENLGLTFSAIYNVGMFAINYLDSPATTSATTYKTQFANRINASSVSVNYAGSLSSITLMEIGA